MQVSLQEKQAYIRANVDKSQFEDFYDFCDRDIGSVDISAWTIDDIAQIIRKFNAHVAQENEEEGHNPHEMSYADYQSAPNQQQLQHNALNNVAEEEPSEGQTSRVAKSSAVDLLDEVFENTSTKSYVERSENERSNHSAVSFDDFQFFTSGIMATDKKEDSFTRQKSHTQASHKTYSPKYDARRSTKISQTPTARVENSQLGFQFFEPNPPKKTSPYLKKEKPQEPVHAQKIHLKEVKTLATTTNGQAARGDKWLVEEKVFHEELTCFKSAIRSQLSDRTLNVFIDKHDIIERSFLAADYAMYYMKVSPLGIECKRNYEDFSRLKKNLEKFFPGVHLPYLDDNSWFNNTNVDFINNQKKMIEFFVRDLLRNKEIRNSRVMEDFLLLKDHKPMKRKFQKYEKMEKLKGLEELCLLDGKVEVHLSSEQKNYNQNMSKFIEKMESCFDRLNKLSEQAARHHSQLQSTFRSLSNLTIEMEKEVKAFNTKVTSNEIKNLGLVLKGLRDTFKEEQSNAKFEHELLTRKILPFLKYEYHNIKQLSKLVDINEKFEKAYEKRCNTEKIGINDSYNSEQTKGLKKGVLEESKSLIVLKYQTAYIGRQLRMESQRLFDELGVKIFHRWQMVGECHLDKLLKNLQFWKPMAKADPNKYNTELTY